MKASELVEKLNALIAEHGDFEPMFDDEAGAIYYIKSVQDCSSGVYLTGE